MPTLSVVARDYANTYRMMTALGPLAAKPGIGSKGIMWPAEEEYEELKEKLGTVAEPGISQGMPSLETGKQVAEAILVLAPETNGEVALKSWEPLEKRTGLSLTHLSIARRNEKFSFDDLTAQPRKIITSPVWSGIESEERRYSAFRDQRRGEGAIPDLDRPGTLLSGSPVDAKLRGGASRLSATS